jgi:DNA-binding beta-propeller fold protein YncE
MLLAQSLSQRAAGEILIVDRLQNSVYAYTDTGHYINTVLTDNTNLNLPDGILVSPDHTKLYVASGGNSEIVRYDYDYATATATNPTVFATSADGLAFPNSMVFSPDGSKIYVANLGGSSDTPVGISQLNVSGGSAGANFGGGSSFSFSGLAYAPGGQLLAGGFEGGTVGKSDAGITSISDFIGPSAALSGVAGVMVNGNDLYVSALLNPAGLVQKFDATTGALDPSFNVSGLAAPQGIMLAPDGNGLLVGSLGFSAGTGVISRIGFDGTLLGVFASPQTDPSLGFTEATAFGAVPEPSTQALAGIALAAVGFLARRRRTSQSVGV